LLTSTRLHGATILKTAIFTDVAVEDEVGRQAGTWREERYMGQRSFKCKSSRKDYI
jgi:hypothetical protein